MYNVIPDYYYSKGDIIATDNFFAQEVANGNERFNMLKAHFYYSRDTDKAIAAYNDILATEPETEEALIYKMHLLGQSHKYDEVLAIANQLLSVGNADPDIVLQKIYALIGKGDIESAWQAVQPLFAAYHGENEVIHAFITVLHKMPAANVPDQVQLYADTLEPQANYQLQYCLGLYYKERRAYDHAVQIFGGLNNIQPFAWNFYQTAIIKNLQNKTDECLEYLKKTFELDPSLKNDAKQYPELQNLWDNPLFIQLVN